jgi:4-hydroxymandelate synthase
MTSRPFDDLRVDHIHFYVTDLAANLDWLVGGYGFGVYSVAESASRAACRTVGLGKDQIRLLVTQPLASHHPAASYVGRHGDGVADIALGVADAAAAFETAVRRGARPVAGPARHGQIVTASVFGFGDVVHTFVQRPASGGGSDERALPGLVPTTAAVSVRDTGLREVDHFAVCVDDGDLAATVEFYERVLDFDLIFTERIEIGRQAITTTVVQSKSGAVTLTLIEPDGSRERGHVAEFLTSHGGPGVQHIAFTADSVVRAIDLIEGRGVDFLSAPATYYGLLAERLGLARYSVAELQQHNVLVDEDHYGQLFQIFAKSVHPRDTFFFELIERAGARTFGSGNIKALYEAVELQRARDAASYGQTKAAS